MSADVLIELDERRRASLGKVGRAEHRRYLAREEPNGVIVLTPAVVLTETETRLWGNPELVIEIERTITDPATRVVRSRRLRRVEE